MPRKKPVPSSVPGDALRRRAEKKIRLTPEEASVLPRAEVRDLIHELHIHQAELEIQNEELRRTQGELVKSQERYRELFDAAPVGYLVLNRHRVILDANRTAEKLMNAKPRQLLGSEMDQFIAFRNQADFRRVIHSRRPEFACEWEFRRCDGSFFQGLLVMATEPGAGGRGVFYRATISDITSQKNIREKIARLAAIAESSAEAIIGLDPEGVIIAWNPAAERIFGYSIRDAMGQPVTLIIPPDRWQESGRLLERARLGAQVRNFETVRLVKGGGQVEVAISLSPVADPTGRVTGISVIERDITEYKRLENELRESARQREEFLAVLGHELRNPLAAMHMLLERMKRVPAEGLKPGHNLIEAFSRNLKYLVRIVDDLLSISRVMRGKLELQSTTVELQAVLRHSADTLKGTLRDKGLALEMSLPPEPLWVHGDPVRLEQVFFNLLDNAVKYTNRGGRVTLAAGRGARGLEIRVKDTGIGMRPEDTRSIFTLFSQLGGAERARAGLGIGLAMVAQLTALHGGSVSAHSAGPGRGSEFTVTLPEAPAPAEGAPAEPAIRRAPCPPSLSNLKILVADDNRDFTVELAEALQEFGCQVRIAHNGAGAVAEAAVFHPRVVLLDIGLPDMDGCEAGRRIIAQPGLESATLIAVTGYGDYSHCLRDGEKMFRQILVKPVEMDKLEEILTSAASQ